MKIVLLSGGSGKRLWPLSNNARSKQFLKVLRNDEGELESMVQRVWRQLRSTGLQSSAYIAVGGTQVEMLQSQLGTLPVITEPERRDTFPAIALSAVYLYSIVGVSLDEVIAVLPVDPFVDTQFFERIRELEHALINSEAELALMGVKPTYPSEKYGYIVPESDSSNDHRAYLKVSHFKEKPREDQAKLLMEQQALWNCGVFAFKLNTLINILIEKGLPIQYDEMVKQYGRLPMTSFDYEVVERARHIVAVPYRGTWKDLGTWNTLTEEISITGIGKGIVSEDSANTHLINELDIPVTVLGLSNVIVAASPDGILVADKAASPRIKDLMKDAVQRPMFEERRWGYYRVLDFKSFDDGRKVLTKRFCVHAGKNLSYQMHAYRSEVWTIISGVGEVVADERLYRVSIGDVLQIPHGSRHSLRAITDLEVIEVQSGFELVEEDTVRLYTEWDDIMQQCIIL
jgi:mannose-1-phosphate guanylyltransferase